MSIKSKLYKGLKYWNDASAVKSGSSKKIAKRVGRRTAGKWAGKGIGKLFR